MAHHLTYRSELYLLTKHCQQNVTEKVPDVLVAMLLSTEGDRSFGQTLQEMRNATCACLLLYVVRKMVEAPPDIEVLLEEKYDTAQHPLIDIEATS